MLRDNAQQRSPTGQTRRGFFKHLLGETIAVVEEFAGRPQLRLEDLGHLPDEKIAKIIPVVSRNYKIVVDETEVSAHAIQTGSVIPLFTVERANTFTFNLFNGKTELGDIARRLAAEMGWEEDESFAYAKQLFLSLTRKRVLAPSNAVW